MKPCGTPRSSRFNGSATRPRSPSVSSTVSTRTIGSLPASSSGDGRLPSLNCGARKKRWRDRRRPRRRNPLASIPVCGRRSWLLVSGFQHSGPIRRSRREHRKALLRCLIEKVVMRRSSRDQAEVRIVWRGGAATELTVMMPVNALAVLPRHAEMEQRVCELAAAGHYDDEIARMLTAEGHRSPWRGTEVLASTVRGIRIRHGVKVRQRTRWPAVSGCLTVTQLAERLQLPQKWIYTQLRRGVLRTVLEPSGRYLFPDTEPAMQAIRELREHRMQRVDLTGGSA